MTRNPVKVLRSRLLPDFLFGNRYSIAPYRGCAHACRYCDGRAEKYHVEGDFEKDLIVRGYLPERLSAELPKLRERGLISIGSGTSDSWQPAEQEHGLTASLLRVLSEGCQPVLAVTKSDLILRDLELLLSINKRNGLLIFVTVTSVDDEIRACFEPGAPPVQNRFDTIRQLSAAGIPVLVLSMPLFPGINDSETDMNRLFEAIKNSGASAVIPGHLTLRPGRQKELFLSALKDYRSRLVPYYQSLFCEDRLSGNPVKSYRDEFYKKSLRLAKDYCMPYLVPHKLFSSCVSRCDELLILLEQMELVYGCQKRDITPLKEASTRYRAWLMEVRKDFNRRRSLPNDYPDEVLTDFIHSGNLGSILGNDKLASHLASVTKEGLRWDHLTGKWY